VADFPHALDEALRAHYKARRDYASPVGSTRGFRARVTALEKAYGTKAAAARAAGIDATTWSRWSTGKQKPGAASLTKIDSAHRGLIRAAKVAAKGTPSGFTIHAIVVCDPGGARYVNARNSGPHRNNGPTDSGYRPFRADGNTPNTSLSRDTTSS
jgi:hypothetical protein